MVDIEYIPENYKSLKTNIWVIIKRLWLVERLRFHVRLSISGLLNTEKVKNFCCWQGDTIYANKTCIYIVTPQQM